MDKFILVLFSFVILAYLVNCHPLSDIPSLNKLQRVLQQVLDELDCKELDLVELQCNFKNNHNITSTVAERLQKIMLPVNSTYYSPLYYLDFRNGVSSECIKYSRPMIRKIKSSTAIFPAYYEEFQCLTPCIATKQQVHYELLQREVTCLDGTKDWIAVDATTEYPMQVTATCTLPAKNQQ